MTRTRPLPWILGAVALAAGAALAIFGVRYGMGERAQIVEGRCKNCNLVLVSIDSLRADHMSLYGYPRKTTPFLEDWAKDALVFDSFFSTAYLTPISEASIHTGLYPDKNGLMGFRHKIDPSVATIAERLKASGYQTMAIGNSQEFAFYKSLYESFSRGFEHYAIGKRWGKTRALDWGPAETLFRDRSRPFFLWIALGSVHAPFGKQLEDRFSDKSYQGPFKDVTFVANLQLYFRGILYPLTPKTTFFIDPMTEELKPKYSKPLDYSKFTKSVKIGPKDLEYVRAQYDNGVYEADRVMRQLAERLRASGVEGETLVVLQSEHGEDLGEHEYIAHYDVWDTTVHVPLVFKSPAISAGRRVRQLVSGVDVKPSILDHLGLEVPRDLDGVSVFDPVKKTELGPGRDAVFLTRSPLWETVLKLKAGPPIFDRLRELDDRVEFKDYAIRTRTQKLIHRRARQIEAEFSVWRYISGQTVERREWELYDLVSDPGELRTEDGAGDEVAELRRRLLDWEREMAEGARRSAPGRELHDYQ